MTQERLTVKKIKEVLRLNLNSRRLFNLQEHQCQAAVGFAFVLLLKAAKFSGH